MSFLLTCLFFLLALLSLSVVLCLFQTCILVSSSLHSLFASLCPVFLSFFCFSRVFPISEHLLSEMRCFYLYQKLCLFGLQIFLCSRHHKVSFDNGCGSLVISLCLKKRFQHAPEYLDVIMPSFDLIHALQEGIIFF